MPSKDTVLLVVVIAFPIALLVVIIWSNVIVTRARKDQEKLIQNLTFVYTSALMYDTREIPRIQLKLWVFVWKNINNQELYVSLYAHDTAAGNDPTVVDAYTVATAAAKRELRPCGTVLPYKNWIQLIESHRADL